MTDREVNGRLNATILDPSRFGWTAGSGVADLLTPHERARRSSTKKNYLRYKRKRDWNDTQVGTIPDCGEGPDVQSNDDEKKKPASEQEAVAEIKKPPPPSNLPSDDSKPSPTVKKGEELATGDDSDPAPVRFSALKRPKTGEEITSECLDWYTYHRGQAGMERRDEETGDLLFDVPPTDTNYGSEEPNWSTAKISIRFPLDDRSREDSGSADGRRHLFRETIFWDWLGNNNIVTDETDLTTQGEAGLLENTPMEVAAQIAEEYCLTFPETLDLAEYIQSQLRSWVKEEAQHTPPYTLYDPYTGQRRDKATPKIIELYGEAISMSEGGFEDKNATSVTSKVLQKSFPVPRRPSSMESSSKKPKAAPQKKEAKKSTKPDQHCLDEVRRRLLAESTEDIKSKHTGDEAVGVLRVQRGISSCHLCQQHTNGMFVQFACGEKGHSYCGSHTRQKLGLSLDGEEAIVLAHCPVCVLHCSCDPCVMKLEKLATEFKARSSKQGCSLVETKFDDLLDTAKKIRVEASDKGKVRSRKKTLGAERTVVPKVPVTDLPREVSEGIDVDPGTDADYAATYTEKGPIFPPGLSFSVKPVVSELSKKVSISVEDGSVDFCNICRNHGSLLCCDFCPRAFHPECLKSLDVDQSESPWECPCCCAEKAGLEEDKIDGTPSLEQISAIYKRNGDSDAENMLLVLASVHQMLLRLMEYDFGYMFSEPVDTNQFPEYLNTVKKPMDLGTISKRLLAGGYRESAEESLETVAIRVLKDIELVWKNCYLFNVEGSSVYRMALVQERRATAIRTKSFSHLLTKRMLEELACDNSNTIKMTRKNCAVETPAPVAVPDTVRPQKSRHKITVSRRNHNGHPIAVFDQDTRKIVKIYSTMQAAGAAVVFLLTKLRHRCEWQNIEIDTVQKVRKIIKTSADKPSYTLFGYRWVMLDQLRNGEVAFPKASPLELPSKADPTPMDVNADKVVRKIDSDGNVLAEFDSIEIAYDDFLNSVKESSMESNGDLSLRQFESYYIGGEKDVQGCFYVVDTYGDISTALQKSELKDNSSNLIVKCFTETNGSVSNSAGSDDVETASSISKDNATGSERTPRHAEQAHVLAQDEPSNISDGNLQLGSDVRVDKIKGFDQNSETNTETNCLVKELVPSKLEGSHVLKNGTHAASQDL